MDPAPQKQTDIYMTDCCKSIIANCRFLNPSARVIQIHVNDNHSAQVLGHNHELYPPGSAVFTDVVPPAPNAPVQPAKTWILCTVTPSSNPLAALRACSEDLVLAEMRRLDEEVPPQQRKQRKTPAAPTAVMKAPLPAAPAPPPAAGEDAEKPTPAAPPAAAAATPAKLTCENLAALDTSPPPAALPASLPPPPTDAPASPPKPRVIAKDLKSLVSHLNAVEAERAAAAKLSTQGRMPDPPAKPASKVPEDERVLIARLEVAQVLNQLRAEKLNNAQILARKKDDATRRERAAEKNLKELTKQHADAVKALGVRHAGLMKQLGQQNAAAVQTLQEKHAETMKQVLTQHAEQEKQFCAEHSRILKQLSAANEEHAKILAAKKEEILRLEKKVEALTQQAENDGKKRTTLKAEVGKLQDEYSHLYQRNGELDKICGELQARALCVRNSHQAQKDAFEKRIEELENLYTQLQDELSIRYEAHQKDRKALKGQTAELEKLCDQLRNRTAAMQQEHQRERVALDKRIVELEKRYAQLKKEKAALEADCERMVEQSAHHSMMYSEMAETIRVFQNEEEKMKKTLSDALEHEESMEAELEMKTDEFKRELAAVDERIVEAEKRTRAEKEAKDKLQAELTKLKEENAAKTKSIQSQKKRISSDAKTIMDLQTKAIQLEAEWKKEKAMLTNNVDALAVQVAADITTKKKFEEARIASNTIHDDLTSQLQQMQQRAKNEEDKISHILANLDLATSNLQHKIKAETELQAKVTSLESSLESKSKEEREQQKKLAELESKLKEFTNDRMNHLKSMEALRVREEAKRVENAELKSNLNQMEEQYMALMREYANRFESLSQNAKVSGEENAELHSKLCALHEHSEDQKNRSNARIQNLLRDNIMMRTKLNDAKKMAADTEKRRTDEAARLSADINKLKKEAGRLEKDVVMAQTEMHNSEAWAAKNHVELKKMEKELRYLKMVGTNIKAENFDRTRELMEQAMLSIVEKLKKQRDGQQDKEGETEEKEDGEEEDYYSDDYEEEEEDDFEGKEDREDEYEIVEHVS